MELGKNKEVKMGLLKEYIKFLFGQETNIQTEIPTVRKVATTSRKKPNKKSKATRQIKEIQQPKETATDIRNKTIRIVTWFMVGVAVVSFGGIIYAMLNKMEPLQIFTELLWAVMGYLGGVFTSFLGSKK